MTQIRGVNWDYPLSKAEIENVNPNADDTIYYYDSNGGTLNIDMSTARHFVIQYHGIVDFTMNLSGDMSKGQTLKVGHIAAGVDTKFTINGKTIYAPDGTTSSNVTFTGGGFLELSAASTSVMMVIAGGRFNT